MCIICDSSGYLSPRYFLSCKFLIWTSFLISKSLYRKLTVICVLMPITVAARPKALTVFARSNTGVVGSNPARGMNVCVRLFCVHVVMCVGSGLATGWSPVHGVLPTVYRIKKLKKRPRSKRLQSHREKQRKYVLINTIHDLWGTLSLKCFFLYTVRVCSYLSVREENSSSWN
jgi:hypothetical protein